jgi:hypothetical protein
MCKGIARDKQHVPDRSLPFTPTLIVEMFHLLDPSLPNHHTFKTSVIFSFELMLRKSNAMPDSVYKFDPSKQLVRGDVTVGQDMLLVTLKWSKTLQCGGRQHIIPMLSILGSQLCPNTAYQQMCELVPGKDTDPLFRVWQAGKWVPMTYPWYTKMLRQCIAQTGRNPMAYSSHSARRGGATYLSQCGVPREVIMLIGDWRSDAVDRYITLPLESKVQALQKVKQHVMQQNT